MCGKWNFSAFLLIGLSAASSWASNPVGFVYQGRLMESNGDPTLATVELKFQIYNPAGDCLLYEETQTVNTGPTNGLFTVSVGSALANGKRTVNDPGLAMTTVFSNPGSQLRGPGTNCGSGYTPSAGDQRRMRVTVTEGGVPDILSPDQILATVPFATTAESLQGKLPGDFIQTKTTGGVVLNQSNMEQVFESSAFAKLVNFLNGSASVDFAGQTVTSVGTPVSATDAVNKSYSDSKLGGRNIASAAPTAGQVMTWSTGTSEWIPTTLPDSALAGAATCGANQASKWDGTTWTCVATGGGGGFGGAGTISTDNATTVLTVASEKVQLVNLPTAGAIKLPDATTFTSTGGPIFQLLNSNANEVAILDFTGKLIGKVPASGGVDVYLFNNSTPAGQWLTTGGTIGPALAVKQSSISVSPDTPTSNIRAGGLSPTKHIVAYSVYDGTTDYDLRAVIVDVNETTQVLTVGAPMTLATNLPFDYTFRSIHVFSATQFLLPVEQNGVYSVYQGTVSGSSISGGLVNITSNCYNATKHQGVDALYCYDSGTTTGHKIPLTGAVQNWTSANEFRLVGKIGTYELIGRCIGFPEELEVKIVDFVGDSVIETQVFPTASPCYLENLFEPNLRTTVAIDASNLWLLMRSTPTNKKMKVNWNAGGTPGSKLSLVGSVETLPQNVGAVALSNGTDQYLVAPSGGNNKAEITDVTTLSLSAPSLWSNCYGPYLTGINRCIEYTPDTGNSIKATFKVGQ